MKHKILLGILFKLLSGEKITLKYVAERFEISERTASRYFSELELAGVPVLTKRGCEGGYYLPDDYRLTASFLTKNELSLLLGALDSIYKELSPCDAESLRDKILASQKAAEREFLLSGETLIIDGSGWSDAAPPRILSALSEAVTKQKVIEISYTDKCGKQSTRSVEPHALVLKQGLWYLYAYCRNRQSFRLFRTARIDKIEVTGSFFERRNAPNPVVSYQKWYGELTREKVLLEIEKTALSEVKEWLGANSVYEENGKFFAKTELSCDEGLVAKVFSFAGRVKVIYPEKLKKLLLSRARNVIKQYE